jgi:hypothetical protein
MLEGVLSLFDNPIADLVTAGILVSIFLHHREMRVLQKRMDELSFQVSDLKILIATIWPAGIHLAPTQGLSSEPLRTTAGQP